MSKAITHKTCKDCGEMKPVEAGFRRNYIYRDGKRVGTNGWGSKCRTCLNRVKEGRRRAVEKYAREALAEKFGDACSICGTGECPANGVLAIDHCHKTERVRGLLCSMCNSVIGFARDNPEVLRSAIEYLEHDQ